MRLIAQKPCNFGGQKFYIGDEIPNSLVANPKAQEKMGVIAIAGGGGAIQPEELQEMTAQVGQVKFEIPIHSEKGEITLELTNEELIVFTDIMQIQVTKTEDKQKVSEMIQNIESEDLLILLDSLDGRKYVKEEAQARAKALMADKDEDGEEQPETTGGDE